MSDLNTLGARFATRLERAQEDVKKHTQDVKLADNIHVVGAGAAVSSVYEQLRNAAEYTEEHLLLQRAIRRFYMRLFLSRSQQQVDESGEELVVELTLAGYIQNDTISTKLAQQISRLASEYYRAGQDSSRNGSPTNDAWTTDVLAVETEALINNHLTKSVFVQFTHDHFVKHLDPVAIFGEARPDFEVSLFVAIHFALLHSDAATVRAMLLKRYRISPGKDLQLYWNTNSKIDELITSKDIDRLTRIVDRQGAPFRVLWRMVDQPHAVELLGSRDKFLRAYEAQVNSEYTNIQKRINSGIIKSVIFLIITKFLVGIAIEVPYDYLVHGAILWTPLLINLFFPPIYMVLLRFTLVVPGNANTVALIDLIDRFLYKGDDVRMVARRSSGTFGAAYNLAYSLFFLVVFGGVAWFLISIGYHLLHLAIFFFFLSTASFLGFRLSRMIRELEVVETNQGGVAVVRDFLYMPFVVVGRWVSDKYSKVNIVTTFLDMVIELPLKTVLRLIRQWSAFISTKKDEL